MSIALLDAAAVRTIAESAGFTILEQTDLAGRPARLAPIPTSLEPGVAALLADRHPVGLYAHQARAIEQVVAGADVCLATATASGKSLVFMASAAHLLRTDASARVIALYPTRALLQDQFSKWRALLGPLGLRVELIDGSVPIVDRTQIASRARVLLMTPDVAHAWLMARAGDAAVRELLAGLRLLVLDEAHVYEGVFGTNMAFFLRRFRAIAAPHRLVASTATIDGAVAFVENLTGRRVRCFGAAEDGSAAPRKTVLVARGENGFDGAVRLVSALAEARAGRFIVFGDSRKMVERVVAAALRGGDSTPEEDVDERAAVGGDGAPDDAAHALPSSVLPYRAGYEHDDRHRIEKALARGELRGVVSTSALELGLDIGDIDLVVLLGAPATMKSFWQRFGRAGRRNAGVCLLVDDQGTLGAGGLASYLARPVEPSWLYLENRYLQFANALCAASELRAVPHADRAPFASLPEPFARYVDNELAPTEAVPADLYPLKQRAQGGPHLEFPIRCGIEPNFKVRGPNQIALGELTLAQVLREAYPGAVYYYLATPYRVVSVRQREGVVQVRRERHYSTRATAQSIVFPNFDGGVRSLWRAPTGFVAEVAMQVSERVVGFVEKRGSRRLDPHRYQAGSPYAQRELNRFFETTGVCWRFADAPCTRAAGDAILDAFCVRFGVQRGDVGVAVFHATRPPSGIGPCNGLCVYDATHGSLRLTQRLGEHFIDVVAQAEEMARVRGDDELAGELAALAAAADCSARETSDEASPSQPTSDDDWAVVIAPGERAMHVGPDGAREVVIRGHRYTPRGLMYVLEPPAPGITWTVAATAVQQLHGITRTMRVNLVSGEEQAVA